MSHQQTHLCILLSCLRYGLVQRLDLLIQLVEQMQRSSRCRLYQPAKGSASTCWRRLADHPLQLTRPSFWLWSPESS